MEWMFLVIGILVGGLGAWLLGRAQARDSIQIVRQQIEQKDDEIITLRELYDKERTAHARSQATQDVTAERLTAHDRVRSLTNLDPAQSCAMATLNFEGVDHAKLVSHLWKKYKIVVISIDYAGVKGIRISPNVYTTLTEIDMFCEAVEHVLKNGFPA